MCLNKIISFYLVVVVSNIITPKKKSKLEMLAELNGQKTLIMQSRLSSTFTGSSSSSSSVFRRGPREPQYHLGLEKLVSQDTDENGTVFDTTMRVAIINHYGLWDTYFKRKFID